MIDPLTILAAGALLFPAADQASVPSGCAARKPFKTEIEIDADIPPTRYRFDVSRRKLTSDQEDLTTKWKSEHEDHVWASRDLSVEGLARGGMGIMSMAKFVGVPYDRYGMYYCPYVKKVIVSLHYNTLIFIAAEHRKGTCDFNATVEHENKHDAINREVVNATLERLKKDLPKIIAMTEGRYVPRGEIENGAKKLETGLQDALRIYSEHMLKEITRRNAALDSPAEYERVAALCPQDR